MADSSILREYLLSLGFKVDEPSGKKIDKRMDSMNKQAVQLGKSVVGVAVSVSAMVATFAYQMEKLYYASKRTDSAVGAIQALEYGGKQIGLSGDTMRNALEGMARAMRSNPGLVGLLNSLGVRVEGRDKSDVLVDLVSQLKKMPAFVAERFANLFGIDADTLFMLTQGLDKLKEAASLRKQMAADAGVDPDSAAKAAMELTNLWRETWERVGLLKDAMSIALVGPAKEFSNLVNKVLQVLTKDIGRSTGFLDFIDKVDKRVAGIEQRWLKSLKGSVDKVADSGSGNSPFSPASILKQLGYGSQKESYKASANYGEGLGKPQLGAFSPNSLLAQLEKQFGLPPGIMDRLWKQESGRGKHMQGPMTRFGERAQGHFQFMSGTAKEMGVSDPHDFQQSAQGAAAYLARLFKQFGGDARKATGAYNWGPGNMAKYGLGRAPKETRDYMDAVAGPSITQTNNITVSGVSDPEQAAKSVGRELSQTNADFVRQFTPRVQ